MIPGSPYARIAEEKGPGVYRRRRGWARSSKERSRQGLRRRFALRPATLPEQDDGRADLQTGQPCPTRLELARMLPTNKPLPERIGLLYSGGLDSAILLGHLLAAGHIVRPFYIRSGMHWETVEQRAAEQFSAALGSSRLEPLVVLSQSVAEVYGTHWSLTGTEVPDAATDDSAVYLPGRNLLLVSKAALWCQLHGIGSLALAVLASNPFPDATDEFFASLERTLELATGQPIRVLRPFQQLSKREVMQLGQRFPLELSFSCIDPQGSQHCGQCNKCAERIAAFAAAQIPDRTEYASHNAARRVATPGH